MLIIIIFLQRTTVRRWVRRYEEGEDMTQRVRAPRPRAISEGQLGNMLATFQESPFTPTRNFAQEYDVSMQTIRNELHRAGVHHRRPAKKIILTQEQKAARVRFARDYRDFDFSYAIFCDEKSFRSSQQGRRNLWRIDNTRYEPRNVTPNAESGRVVVNMWGWMSAAGPGELAFIPGRANGHTYKEVLQNIMLPTVRTVYPEMEVPEFYFFQDNCPIHRALVVREWLREQPQIKTVPWPPRSPDLNPIENLWGLMVQKWDNRAERTKEALVTHCEQAWETLRGSNLCEVLVRSMRNRCDAVIDAGGAATKY